MQGSNLPAPGLESGVPPLELTAHLLQVRREGLEPPRTHEESAALQAAAIAALPPTHFQTISVEGFEPSTPCARGTCAAKLRHTLNKTPYAPGGNRTQRFPVESRASWPLDDGSGCSRTHGWIRTTNDAINSRGLYQLSYMGNIVCTSIALH